MFFPFYVYMFNLFPKYLHGLVRLTHYIGTKKGDFNTYELSNWICFRITQTETV